MEIGMSLIEEVLSNKYYGESKINELLGKLRENPIDEMFHSLDINQWYRLAKVNREMAVAILQKTDAFKITKTDSPAGYLSAKYLTNIAKQNNVAANIILRENIYSEQLSIYQLVAIAIASPSAAEVLIDNPQWTSRLDAAQLAEIAKSSAYAAKLVLDKKELAQYLSKRDFIEIFKKTSYVFSDMIESHNVLDQFSIDEIFEICKYNAAATRAILQRESWVNQFNIRQLFELSKRHYSAAEFLLKNTQLAQQLSVQELYEIVLSNPVIAGEVLKNNIYASQFSKDQLYLLAKESSVNAVYIVQSPHLDKSFNRVQIFKLATMSQLITLAILDNQGLAMQFNNDQLHSLIKLYGYFTQESILKKPWLAMKLSEEQFSEIAKEDPRIFNEIYSAEFIMDQIKSMEPDFNFMKRIIQHSSVETLSVPDTNGNTLMHHAAARGSIKHLGDISKTQGYQEIIQLLISKGVNKNIRNNQRETPFSSARNTEEGKKVKEILSGYPSAEISKRPRDTEPDDNYKSTKFTRRF